MKRAGYVTVAEAAERVGVSEPTMRRRIRNGAIPAYRDPADHRRRLVKVREVDAYFGDHHRLEPDQSPIRLVEVA